MKTPPKGGRTSPATPRMGRIELGIGQREQLFLLVAPPLVRAPQKDFSVHFALQNAATSRDCSAIQKAYPLALTCTDTLCQPSSSDLVPGSPSSLHLPLGFSPEDQGGIARTQSACD